MALFGRELVRIFLFVEIAGEFARLKRGLLELGHQVTFCDFYDHPFRYGGIDPMPEALSELIQDERQRELRWLELHAYRGPVTFSHLMNLLMLKMWSLKNILKFCWFANAYDAFVFNFGYTFNQKNKLLKFNDLFWLRLIGKTVVFRINGSEARPLYLDGFRYLPMEDKSAETVANLTRETKENNRAIDKYATYIIANTFLTYFLTRPIVPIQLTGTPIQIDADEAPTAVIDDDRAVVILHAPSRTDAKNTSAITEMINELKHEGLNIDFRIISGRPNEEVISEIKGCDFIVDQMYSDLAIATFATEAAYFGRPAVVGGYLSESQLASAYAKWGVPPSEFCHPSQMKAAVRRLVVDPDRRRQLGTEAMQYVRKYWSPRAVAERWERILRNDAPRDWFWDPKNQEACPPVCISAEKAGEIVASIVDTLGDEALCLDDKPALKEMVLKLIHKKIEPVLTR